MKNQQSRFVLKWGSMVPKMPSMPPGGFRTLAEEKAWVARSKPALDQAGANAKIQQRFFEITKPTDQVVVEERHLDWNQYDGIREYIEELVAPQEEESGGLMVSDLSSSDLTPEVREEMRRENEMQAKKYLARVGLKKAKADFEANNKEQADRKTSLKLLEPYKDEIVKLIVAVRCPAFRLGSVNSIPPTVPCPNP